MFDEQPDGDIHGECAVEIKRLEKELAATVKDSLTAGKAQMARDSAELRRLCAERDQLKAKCVALEGYAAAVEKSADKAEAELAALKAQEPIGWYTDDHLTDKSATTYDRAIAERWDEKGWQLWPLYAAPSAGSHKEQG